MSDNEFDLKNYKSMLLTDEERNDVAMEAFDAGMGTGDYAKAIERAVLRKAAEWLEMNVPKVRSAVALRVQENIFNILHEAAGDEALP